MFDQAKIEKIIRADRDLQIPARDTADRINNEGMKTKRGKKWTHKDVYNFAARQEMPKLRVYGNEPPKENPFLKKMEAIVFSEMTNDIKIGLIFDVVDKEKKSLGL